MKAEDRTKSRSREYLREAEKRELKELSPDRLLEHCLHLRNDLKEKDRLIEKKDLEIENLRKKVQSLQVKDSDLYESYPKSASGVEKIRFILNRTKKALNYQELKGLLLKLDPALKDRWSNIDSGLSHLLFKAVAYGAIKRCRKYANNRGYYEYSKINRKDFSSSIV